MDKALINENLIKLLGIEPLPEERRAKIVDQASELAEKRMLFRVLKELAPEKRSELESILDRGGEQDISAFLEQYCPNYIDWLIEEISNVKKELSTLANSQELG